MDTGPVRFKRGKRSSASRFPFSSRVRLMIMEYAHISDIAQAYDITWSEALRIVIRESIDRLSPAERRRLKATADALAAELNKVVDDDADDGDQDGERVSSPAPVRALHRVVTRRSEFARDGRHEMQKPPG